MRYLWMARADNDVGLALIGHEEHGNETQKEMLPRSFYCSGSADEKSTDGMCTTSEKPGGTLFKLPTPSPPSTFVDLAVAEEETTEAHTVTELENVLEPEEAADDVDSLHISENMCEDDCMWRWNLLMFGLAFSISWLVFALFWWVIAVIHQDHAHLEDPEWVPCVVGVHDFTTAFLFSVETQHTIGYGSRAIETKCPQAILLLMLQSCFGVFIQSLMTGLIFAKLSRPKGRAQTMMFSRQAVICQRDGEYCLLFRLGDMRKSHIIGTTIRALIVKNRLTSEGEEIPMCKYRLKLETETKFDGGYIFLVWPVTVVHRIDCTSPLWELSAESLLTAQFEIIVILEGIVESTGSTTQFRTSYLPYEVLWGHRLMPLHTHQKPNGQYDIDYTEFHNLIPVPSMPRCSAKDYSEREAASINQSGQDKPCGGYLPNFSVGGPVTRSSGLYRRISVSLSKTLLSSAGNDKRSRISESSLNGNHATQNEY